jgi:hypothetical protein
VAPATLDVPQRGQFAAWKQARLARLRELTFHHFPERVPPARGMETDAAGVLTLETESPIRIRLRPAQVAGGGIERVWIVAAGSSVAEAPPGWLKGFAGERDAVYICEPRGLGASRWTVKSPPNYVARSHLLLGRTVDSGRVWDLAAAARFARGRHGGQTPVYLAGEGPQAMVCAFAALLEPDVAGLVLARFPATFMDGAAPPLLNVLRVADIPAALGLLAPRPLTVLSAPAGSTPSIAALYRAAGVPDKFLVDKE